MIGTGRIARGWAEWRPVILLGVLTIGSYGLVLYGFGVISGPAQEAEGWSSAEVNLAFTLTYLLAAAPTLVSGRLLDRIGPTPLMLAGLVVGTVLLAASTWTTSAAWFAGLWAVGGAVTVAGLFYNVTMAVTARLYPERQSAAFTVLVTTGGFSSVVFLPLTGVLTEELGWRWAIRVLLVLSAALALPAVASVRSARPGPAEPGADEARPDADETGYSSIRAALRSPQVLVLLAMFAFGGLALGALLNHLVPALTAMGIGLSTAAGISGLRGFMSLPGRALIAPLISLLGLRSALGVAYAAMTLGTAVLAAAEWLPGGDVWIYVFAVLTGLVFGQLIPLQGLLSAEVFGLRRIGTFMAIQTVIGNLTMAAGPFAAALAVDALGDFTPVLAGACVAHAAALLLLPIQGRLRGRRSGGSLNGRAAIGPAGSGRETPR